MVLSHTLRVRMKSMDSADSDEEYVADEVDEDQHSDEFDSFAGEEDDDEEWRTGAEPRSRKLVTRSRKKEAEVDFKSVEDKGGWRTVIKPRVQVGSARFRKNGVKRPEKRRKVTSNFSEDSDDDDDEFMPNDFDSLEEDEEFSNLNTKKRRRIPSRGKSSVKSQRRKGTTKTRAKHKPLRRNKRVIDRSGSDFCSDSTDFEFTTSEEEQEQVIEANQICRSLRTNLRCSRKIREDEAFFGPPVSKGKEKAEEKKNDEGKSVCGVCLTEEGINTLRGTLNCCSHFFCFSCIMEWSKVESRCPVCKQRFVTISKPARCVKGFDLRSAIIQVPERDQVYQPSEEELQGFLNPYEDVICTECHEGGDDALMLLCDICDSSAHTYCVGLGREVPEGNWYCDGCRPAFGSSHSQTQVFTPERPTTFENMTEIDLNVTIPETPISQGNDVLPSPTTTTGIGASTVSGRRIRIHRIFNMFSDRSSQADVDRSREENLFQVGQASNSTDMVDLGAVANRVRRQVHLLVRSELKSLSLDTNLGHDAYAEISRRSVDTVMASCGLELRKNDVYEAQLPICLHIDGFENVQSSPISGCCLTCFETFVKNVLRKIMDITLGGPHWSRF